MWSRPESVAAEPNRQHAREQQWAAPHCSKSERGSQVQAISGGSAAPPDGYLHVHALNVLHHCRAQVLRRGLVRAALVAAAGRTVARASSPAPPRQHERRARSHSVDSAGAGRAASSSRPGPDGCSRGGSR